MIKSSIIALGIALAATATASQFTPGDLVVYRVGDGSSSLVNTGNSVFLDEYTTAGSLVQSINVSGMSSSGFLASGTATSEGMLNLSSDGRFLTFTGYDTTGIGSSLPASTSVAVPRAIGLVGAAGTLLSQTNLGDFASGNNPRSAFSTNGSDLWITGAATGIAYTSAGNSTSLQLSTTVTNLRVAGVFGGQLYVSTSSGSSVRLGTVGTGTPTTSGQTITNLPGFPTTGSPYSFFFADLSANVAGLDTLYVADDTANTGGIEKFSLVGGTWVANGTIVAASVRGLTASVNGGIVSLYGATGGSTTVGGGSIYGFSDSSGYNGAVAGSASTIATASANEAFRGIAFAPQAVPEPASMAVLGVGALALIRRRRGR